MAPSRRKPALPPIPSTYSSRDSFQLVLLGEKLTPPTGDAMLALQAATLRRKELLDKVSQSLLDYMLRKLASGQPLMYPNDAAGWVLANPEMLHTVLKDIPDAGMFIDGEFVRLWWLVKDCM